PGPRLPALVAPARPGDATRPAESAALSSPWHPPPRSPPGRTQPSRRHSPQTTDTAPPAPPTAPLRRSPDLPTIALSGNPSLGRDLCPYGPVVHVARVVSPSAGWTTLPPSPVRHTTWQNRPDASTVPRAPGAVVGVVSGANRVTSLPEGTRVLCGRE